LVNENFFGLDFDNRLDKLVELIIRWIFHNDFKELIFVIKVTEFRLVSIQNLLAVLKQIVLIDYFYDEIVVVIGELTTIL
jgi:hypothetical protein